MPSVAFARPMWPATLRALRELTRLALATLVLAVGLGGAAASGPPDRPAADLGTRPVAAEPAARPFAAELPARPIADNLATRPLAAELPAWQVAATRPVAATVVAHPAAEAVRAADELPAWPVPALAQAGPPAQHLDAGPGPSAAILAHHVAAPRPTAGHGEPTRRGPPSA
ncbi:hypothetical protein C1I95_06125 [Micromonospora craterilacus]|uniref:Uncharacterized protein n=1 Tax=Micromonospora craterilacus TaxID=1655439 RepID=A0A2W2FJR4_9ACTN|nr:hypothetical protein [Micromonospora craterilacus]PZG22027.1 hypothetical protein C1I95_06125 [Micromonospora craterilacus]